MLATRRTWPSIRWMCADWWHRIRKYSTTAQNRLGPARGIQDRAGKLRFRVALQRNPRRRNFNSPHIIHPLQSRFLPSHNTAAGALRAEQAADTAAVEGPAVAVVAAREVVPAAGLEAVRAGRAAGLEAVRVGRAVVRAPVGLALAVG